MRNSTVQRVRIFSAFGPNAATALIFGPPAATPRDERDLSCYNGRATSAGEECKIAERAP